MTKTICCSMDCPFTHRSCTDCAIYRGRHHYLMFSERYQGHTDGPKDNIAAYFQAVEEFLDPWAGKGIQTENAPGIRLKVVDVESEKIRFCEFDEAKTWDWGNPEMMRLIDGRQVKSFDNLFDILCYKAENGHREVEILEYPRFMLLAGG